MILTYAITLLYESVYDREKVTRNAKTLHVENLLFSGNVQYLIKVPRSSCTIITGMLPAGAVSAMSAHSSSSMADRELPKIPPPSTAPPQPDPEFDHDYDILVREISWSSVILKFTFILFCRYILNAVF